MTNAATDTATTTLPVAAPGVPIGLNVGTLSTRIALGSISINDSEEGRSVVLGSDVISNENGERFTPTFVVKESSSGSDEEALWVIGDSAKKLLTREHSTVENKGCVRSQSLVLSKENPELADYTKQFLSHMSSLSASGGGIAPSDGAKRLRVVASKKTPTFSQKNATSAPAVEGNSATLHSSMLAGFGPNTCMSYLDEGVAVVVANGLASSPSVTRNVSTYADAAPSEVAASWKRAIVVNWGGAGFNLTEITRFSNTGVLNLTKSECSNALSGEAIVDIVYNFVSGQFTRKNPGLNVDSKKSISKLREAVVSSLKVLGLSRTCSIEVDGLVEGVDCRVNLSRGRLEMLCGSSFSDFEEVLGSFVQESGADESVPVDVCLFAGGMCNMPAVQEMIKKVLPDCWYGLESLSVEEAVVTGCAIQATLLNHSGLLSFEENQSFLGINGSNNEVTKDEITVSSLSFSAGVGDSSKTEIMAAGTPLGITCYGIVKDVKVGDKVSVFMGGDKAVALLEDLGEGDVEVSMKLNLDGTVEVGCGGVFLQI
ncbi:hypothetical protein ScalyP_jg2956 [Parmales sp. scaly parma]|nr:hypothetical protein ScalyP_jg2956 [Parmales sp. scaly parma]